VTVRVNSAAESCKRNQWLTFNTVQTKLLHDMVAKRSRYPSLTSYKAGQVCVLDFLQRGNNLDGTAATSDDTNALSLEFLPLKHIVSIVVINWNHVAHTLDSRLLNA